MDSRGRNREKAKIWISDRRNKSMLIAVIALMTIVALQVGNLRPQKLMCPIYSDCQLKSIDLQRMQIALCKAGLKEFVVKDNQLLVPQQQQALYLQALAEHNAVPSELQDPSTSAALTNPFLSHAQQVSIQREARNRKLQEMLMLLPFVDQAWLEMDETAVRGAFHAPEKSAVVTVRPKRQQPLADQQIYTIRQLVGGAVSSLHHDRIVIVDLATGFAHQGNTINEAWEQKLNAQRATFSRQQNLEQRLREAMQHFDGLKVMVLMETAPETDDQTAQVPSVLPPNSQPGTIQLVAAESDDELTLVGANGQVSLPAIRCSISTESGPAENQNCDDSPAPLSIPLTAITFDEPVSLLSVWREKVTVMVEIPEYFLISRYGRADGIELQQSKIKGSHRDHHRVLQTWLGMLKPELEQTIRPVLAMHGFGNAPVVFNVIPDPAVVKTGWLESVRPIVAENWPSLAVLLVGIALISLNTDRGRTKTRETTSSKTLGGIEESTSKPGTAATLKLADSDANESTRVQLSQMIEDDPDGAARVIENWIRDAA
jgi:hypothetical protein